MLWAIAFGGLAALAYMVWRIWQIIESNRRGVVRRPPPSIAGANWRGSKALVGENAPAPLAPNFSARL